MDCDAMFQESEAKLAANKNLIAAEKVKLYEMAIKAYQQCEQGNEKMASDLFDQIFDTSDRM
jgi:hypothetical protein